MKIIKEWLLDWTGWISAFILVISIDIAIPDHTWKQFLIIIVGAGIANSVRYGLDKK